MSARPFGRPASLDRRGARLKALLAGTAAALAIVAVAVLVLTLGGAK